MALWNSERTIRDLEFYFLHIQIRDVRSRADHTQPILRTGISSNVIPVGELHWESKIWVKICHSIHCHHVPSIRSVEEESVRNWSESSVTPSWHLSLASSYTWQATRCLASSSSSSACTIFLVISKDQQNKQWRIAAQHCRLLISNPLYSLYIYMFNLFFCMHSQLLWTASTYCNLQYDCPDATRCV